MTETTRALFAMPASGGKPVIAVFDGGAQTSDIGVALLAAVERRFGFIDRLAQLVPDRRDPGRVTHRLTTCCARGCSPLRRATRT